jgi:hypothetical protein
LESLLETFVCQVGAVAEWGILSSEGFELQKLAEATQSLLNFGPNSFQSTKNQSLHNEIRSLAA